MADPLPDEVLRVRIRCLLLLGYLPLEGAIQRRVTQGRGDTCAACYRKIEQREVEVQLHFPACPRNAALRMHEVCEGAWDAERAQTAWPAHG